MSRDLIFGGNCRKQYSAPVATVLQMEVENVLCQSMSFGQNGSAGSDISMDDIIDGGEF